jgi:hypothetical protein
VTADHGYPESLVLATAAALGVTNRIFSRGDDTEVSDENLYMAAVRLLQDIGVAAPQSTEALQHKAPTLTASLIGLQNLADGPVHLLMECHQDVGWIMGTEWRLEEIK